jgi:hypothetical protein
MIICMHVVLFVSKMWGRVYHPLKQYKLENLTKRRVLLLLLTGWPKEMLISGEHQQKRRY